MGWQASSILFLPFFKDGALIQNSGKMEGQAALIIIKMEDLKCYKNKCKVKPSGYCDCTPSLTIFCERHAFHHMKFPAEKNHRNLDLYRKPDSRTRWLVIDALHKLKHDVKICKKNMICELSMLFNCLKNWREKSISLLNQIESCANLYLKEAVKVSEVPDLPKVCEISLALRLHLMKLSKDLRYGRFKQIG